MCESLDMYIAIILYRYMPGVPEAYEILEPFPKDNTDQFRSQKQVVKGTMAKIGYSIQGTVAKVKDTVANG